MGKRLSDAAAAAPSPKQSAENAAASALLQRAAASASTTTATTTEVSSSDAQKQPDANGGGGGDDGGGGDSSSSSSGADLRGIAVAAAFGAAVRFLLPVPEGVDPHAWDLLGFFVATVVGLIAEPLPAGAWALLCAGSAVAAGAITFEGAFAAADTPVLWLIVLSFLLARGFDRSGLGERAAQTLVSRFGGSTRGLAASLAVGEALIGPAMPSTTARAAGIFLPVIKSVSAAAGSYPGGACRV